MHSAEDEGSLPELRPVMQPPRFQEYRDTGLWAAIAELAATREISMNTAPEYVIAYVCSELAAKKLVALAGFEK